ncbi:hypothetical protein RvY_07532 [Ramazzottius varieornatus]|uniref:Uridylate-specific endoribonuclease n=1 Tax=Ramazzottius varieornatus TaxID=947166 RepID=A0A1D1VBZ4_RAMVA|nr:hypothetical protein RvY_07532 [Ramazzottius varieornatus]
MTCTIVFCLVSTVLLFLLTADAAPRARHGKKGLNFNPKWAPVYHPKIYRGQGGFYPPRAKGHKFAPTPDYSAVMQRMWDLDRHGMTSASMQLAFQGNTTTSSTIDHAPDRLFAYVDEDVLLSFTTVTAFLALTDNYIDQSGIEETETEEETEEIDHFLDLVIETDVMKEAHRFLREKSPSTPSMGEPFKNLLKEIWFSLYPRSKNFSQPFDSSGFEHVFIGDSKAKQRSVGGLHNWIRAYYLEKDGIFDYTGYIDNITAVPPGRYVAGARYRAYHNYWKQPFSSFFFGSSPEFDLASFTLCLLLEPNRQCRFTLHNERLSIRSLKYGYGTNYVETAYPDVT